MSVFSNLSKGRVIIGLFVFLAVTLISSPGFAQSEPNSQMGPLCRDINISIPAARFPRLSAIPAIRFPRRSRCRIR